MIICLSGANGIGKSTTGQKLSIFLNCPCTHLAEPIKEWASKFTGKTRQQLEEAKRTDIEVISGYKARDLFVFFGESPRSLVPTMFVDHAMSIIGESKMAVVCDVRKDIEVQTFRTKYNRETRLFVLTLGAESRFSTEDGLTYTVVAVNKEDFAPLILAALFMEVAR